MLGLIIFNGSTGQFPQKSKLTVNIPELKIEIIRGFLILKLKDNNSNSSITNFINFRKSYHALRAQLKKYDIKLPYYYFSRESLTIQLPKLTEWQQYGLASVLQLETVNQSDKSKTKLSTAILEQAYTKKASNLLPQLENQQQAFQDWLRSDHNYGQIKPKKSKPATNIGFVLPMTERKKAYILLGGKLDTNNEGKRGETFEPLKTSTFPRNQQSVTITWQYERQQFWISALENFQIGGGSKFNETIETVIRLYLERLNKKNDPNRTRKYAEQTEKFVTLLADAAKKTTPAAKFSVLMDFLEKTMPGTRHISKALKSHKGTMVLSIIEDFEADKASLNNIQKELLIKIKEYIQDEKKLSTPRACQCAALAELIKNNTDLNQLHKELERFFNAKSFHKGLRSTLKNKVLDYFKKPLLINETNFQTYRPLITALYSKQSVHLDDKKNYEINGFILHFQLIQLITINPNQITEKYQPYITAYFKTLKPGEIIKKATPCIATPDGILQFNRTLKHAGDGKIFFAPEEQKKENLLGEGSYGKVKRQALIKVTKEGTLKRSKHEWVQKTFIKKDEHDLKSEIDSTKHCAPDLKPTADILNSKGSGAFFMRNAGKHTLTDLISGISDRKELPYETILGILKDLLSQAKNAEDKGFVMLDIKPGNVMYNPETKKTKIIDHLFSLRKIGINPKNLLSTPLYMPPEIPKFEQDNSDGLNKVMIFAIGMTVSQLIVGEAVIESRKKYKYIPFDKPLNLEVLDTYANEHSQFSGLIQLLKQMTDIDNTKRPEIQDALVITNELLSTLTSTTALDSKSEHSGTLTMAC